MNSLLGLDIGAHTIKIAQLDRISGVNHLARAGIAENPAGSVKLESDLEINGIASTIKKLINDIGTNIREVAIALPESQVFTRVIYLPLMDENQLESAVNWEAENLIPHPLDEVSYSWKTINIEDSVAVKEKQMQILLVSAPLKLIEKYTNLLKASSLDARLMETESVAIGRVLKLTHPEKEYIVVLQIGGENSNVGVYYSGELVQTQSISAAGEALTRGIATGLGLDEKSSEEYKKAYGLTKQLEGKVASSITPVLENIALETKKAITNYEQKDRNKIKLVVLAGGSVLMPGIAEYFTAKLGMEVQITDPLGVVETEAAIAPTIKQHGPNFIVAIGLALAA